MGIGSNTCLLQHIIQYYKEVRYAKLAEENYEYRTILWVLWTCMSVLYLFTDNLLSRFLSVMTLIGVFYTDK
jgi:hypothetical protein